MWRAVRPHSVLASCRSAAVSRGRSWSARLCPHEAVFTETGDKLHLPTAETRVRLAAGQSEGHDRQTDRCLIHSRAREASSRSPVSGGPRGGGRRGNGGPAPRSPQVTVPASRSSHQPHSLRALLARGVCPRDGTGLKHEGVWISHQQQGEVTQHLSV